MEQNPEANAGVNEVETVGQSAPEKGKESERDKAHEGKTVGTCTLRPGAEAT